MRLGSSSILLYLISILYDSLACESAFGLDKLSKVSSFGLRVYLAVRTNLAVFEKLTGRQAVPCFCVAPRVEYSSSRVVLLVVGTWSWDRRWLSADGHVYHVHTRYSTYSAVRVEQDDAEWREELESWMRQK